MSQQLYTILPLELKVTTEDKKKLDLLYDQNARLIQFLQWHYGRRYGELAANKFAWDKNDYERIIKPFLESAGISMSLGLVRNQIDKVLETMKGTYWRRTKPDFENIKSILRVRVTNRNKTKKGELPKVARNREFTLSLVSDAIFFKAKFAEWCGIKGYIGYVDSFNDKLRYQQLINAIAGVDDYGIGDPSEVYRTKDGRYIMNVAIKKTVPKVQTVAEKAKVIGFNLNMAKYLGVAVIHDEVADTFTGLSDSLFVDANNIIERVFREKHFQSLKSMRMRRNKRPYRKGERGDTIARTTRMDKSWLAEQYTQLTYYCANQLIKYAVANGVRVIKIENLRSFQAKKHRLSVQRKKWGKIYRLSKRRNVKALGFHRAYLRMTKIANMFKYLQFTNDMVAEGARHGIEVRLLPPRKSSLTCSSCGYEDVKNLESIKKFKCLQCGLATESDWNAAKNNSMV